MSHIWTFSPSSEVYLQRCLAAAKLQNSENKWSKKFKRNCDTTGVTEDYKKEILNQNVQDIIELDAKDAEVENPVILEDLIDVEFFDAIESEQVIKLIDIVEKCKKTPSTAAKLANKLSKSAIEKICTEVFETTEINEQFLEIFYMNFFPSLLKRDCTWFSLELLMKAEKSHSVQFKKLLKRLFTDLEVANKIVQDYFQSLQENEKNYFMENLLDIELSLNEFEHHIYTVFIVYKECKKSEQIQDYVENLLIKYEENFTCDKNFGRLLLAFLQESKNYKLKNYDKMERVLEKHQSPFKKPCQNVFKDIVK